MVTSAILDEHCIVETLMRNSGVYMGRLKEAMSSMFMRFGRFQLEDGEAAESFVEMMPEV